MEELEFKPRAEELPGGPRKGKKGGGWGQRSGQEANFRSRSDLDPGRCQRLRRVGRGTGGHCGGLACQAKDLELTPGHRGHRRLLSRKEDF